MVKKNIFTFSLLMSLFGCGQKMYKIEKNKYGQPILDDKAKYSFTETPTLEDIKKIDTTAYYVQIFPDNFDREEITKNPRIIIFHNDGFFKNESLLYFGKFDEHRNKKSVYYGGKYRINNDEILIENFIPSSPIGKRYLKKIIPGKILENGNKIIFDFGEYIQIFEKKNSIPKK
ncbi:hypothetical protein [Chishuiella changwenlii]|uniref:hypothetical protein n=1 Tax=Chishuiella changwenlii TaxID=1434701 RepID=UPI002FDB04C0